MSVLALMVWQLAYTIYKFSASQSAHLYHNTIAELLAYRPKDFDALHVGPQIEALMRLMSNLSGSFELLTVEPGIKLALEQILIDEAKMESDAIARNLNVLKNLLTLIRYEFPKQFSENNCLNASEYSVWRSTMLPPRFTSKTFEYRRRLSSQCQY